MNRCYLSLGSNLKSPERQLRQAIASLRKLPSTHIIKVATFYHNKAWGRRNLPDFCNTVILLQTTLKPQYLLSICQRIERAHGRVRKVRWGSRTLDIDILLFGNLKVRSPKLTLPHPALHLRDFVLIPLLEIASGSLVINNSTLSELIKCIRPDRSCHPKDLIAGQ
ncbi:MULTISPECIES: 2-amino-4-hydroxy-6-hydroxymethyldihydropteridine diphosphokinase [unclassified Legionella]|uniref:2-amino-4-hydroxy-6- hydroxymethyldihydropteridine diphosphokinase n=1 Tax=unclassified Legionella TaxID=2622702 RepID=UPI0010547629|nr:MULTISPECIES: 2-amino-4-hydroxy-6-hydroxymethyldihydropteridine diphosphokinase [unclassified Legionella]MDI9818884.1 2-amino-4-hydroxy-6-hydroxymethyldihydropteridine diphosphokinase [Legionella sp. PL877]